MKINLETEKATMQEVVDLVALAIRETVEVMRSEVETSDEALRTISGNIDSEARTYADEPRFKALLKALADQVMAINTPGPRTEDGRITKPPR